MTKGAALQSFWESFGLPTYEESSVPPDAAFPYLTYQYVSGSFGDPVLMSASLWYKTTSWKDANAKAEQISEAIGRSGIYADYDTGSIWIQRGTPFAQSMGDPEIKNIKRKIINIIAEYLSAN